MLGSNHHPLNVIHRRRSPQTLQTLPRCHWSRVPSSDTIAVPYSWWATSPWFVSQRRVTDVHTNQSPAIPSEATITVYLEFRHFRVIYQLLYNLYLSLSTEYGDFRDWVWIQFNNTVRARSIQRAQHREVIHIASRSILYRHKFTGTILLRAIKCAVTAVAHWADDGRSIAAAAATIDGEWSRQCCIDVS